MFSSSFDVPVAWSSLQTFQIPFLHPIQDILMVCSLSLSLGLRDFSLDTSFLMSLCDLTPSQLSILLFPSSYLKQMILSFSCLLQPLDYKYQEDKDPVTLGH